jgi:hypothetical protein
MRSFAASEKPGLLPAGPEGHVLDGVLPANSPLYNQSGKVAEVMVGHFLTNGACGWSVGWPRFSPLMSWVTHV